MSMILKSRRNKKKLKKAAQQLQEAQQQQALLASLQQNGAFTPAMSVIGGNMGLYEKDEELVDGSTGSDPDGDMLLDSLSLGSQHQQKITTVGSGGGYSEAPDNSPPSAHQSYTLPLYMSSSSVGVPATPQHYIQQHQHQFSLPASVTAVTAPAASIHPTTANTKSDQQHSVLRKASHPVLPLIPVSETQPMSFATPTATGVNNSSQTLPPPSHQSPSHHYHHQKLTGTLKKTSKEQKKISQEKAELISTALAFGLGRGIDATDKKPWLNKKPYQVRRVHSSIIETNEGSILMNYDHEMQGNGDMEEEFLSSLNPPEPSITIHMEDELDRNVSSTRRVVGRRVVTRSIGFQADFEEKYPDGDMMKLNRMDSVLIPKDPAEVVYNTQTSGHTFEERVCQWLLHRLAQKCGQSLHKTGDENPVDRLAKLIQSGSKSSQGVENEVKLGCLELVQSLKVTHYVTGMQLGAMEYRILSESEYHKKMAMEGAFGVDKLTSILSTQQGGKLNKKKCSELRNIGKIGDDTHVTKGEDESVLQVRVQSIVRLIKLPAVKAALTSALIKYMEGTQASEGGPFVIKCTGRDLYLTVNKFNNYEVEATDIPTEASLFYFQTTDDGGNPFEFHIAYYGEDTDPNDQTTSEQSTSVGRYLEAPLSAQGRCPGPLLMKHSVKVKNTRFTLRSRLSKKNSKSHLAEWIAGEDAFYVACATKKYQHGSYLAVKNIKNTGDLIGKHFFMTYCDSTIHSHNGENVMMLFQLCTKDSVINKVGGTPEGRGTPGKLPMNSTTQEIIVRKDKINGSSGTTPLLR